MKKRSSLIYRQMVKALGKALYRDDMPQYSAAEPLKPDEKADLNLVIWGDPQISLLSPLRAARVACACRDIRRAAGKYDALILAGDITEYGAQCEYQMMSALLRTVTHKFDHVFAVPGNHDVRLRLYKKQVRRFHAFLDTVKGAHHGSEDNYCFSYNLKGYKLIMLGADRTSFEASYLSAEQLQWLEREIASADESKPVFVINHQPLKLTHGLPLTFLGKGSRRGSVGRESAQLRAIFEKHQNVVYITGHLHYCTSRYTYEDYGSFKAISAPTVGVINHGDYQSFTQGLVLSVSQNKISARARVFGEGKYVEKERLGSNFEIELPISY